MTPRHETKMVDTGAPSWIGGKRIECKCGFKSRNIGNHSNTQFHDLREAARQHLAEKRA